MLFSPRVGRSGYAPEVRAPQTLTAGLRHQVSVLACAMLVAWTQDGPPARGSYDFTLEGELSRHEFGAARFEGDQKLDGKEAFVVQLQTPALEGGVFVAFAGKERPTVGTYAAVEAETKGMDGYQKIELSDSEVAILFYEMERGRMVLLGSTGEGAVEITQSEDDTIVGTIDVRIEGAVGNPQAFLSVRPKRARLVGAFDAEPGDVEFRKP